MTGYNWELYNVYDDPTESNDLAAQMPDKVKELQTLFYAEAAKYGVLPLDNSTLARWNAPRPNLTGGRTEFTYSGTLTGVPNSGAPNILNKAYTITAEVTIPSGGAEGMIVTDGGRFGGYGLFLTRSYRWWLESPLVRNVGIGLLVLGLLLLLAGAGSRGRRRLGKAALGFGTLWLVAVLATRLFGLGGGKPVFLYNLLDLERTFWTGPSLGAGKHTIVFDWTPTEPGLGKGGTGVLSVDGKEVARNTMEHSIPVTFPEDESFDVGADTRSGVALARYRYDPPFKFTGTLDRLTIKLTPEPPPATP